jgi:ABC-2 type transport system ATP-binding protein
VGGLDRLTRSLPRVYNNGAGYGAAVGALEVSGLRKTYRTRTGLISAVADLDLDVPEGEVFGFLGPNGSGKTTTIRAVVGLLRPSAGTIRLFGVDIARGLSSVIDRVGALVEAPSFFPSFSGRRNLALLARSRAFPLSRVEEVLDTVGLIDRADSRVSTYSLGMRQRLGVAAVLLKDPALLILDEPANGLDPEGILETRNLLRRLASEGRTVFVSSHILAEIQNMCDRVAVLSRGRCVAVGTVAELLRGGVSRYRVSLPGGSLVDDRALIVLKNAGLTTTRGEHGGLVVEIDSDDAHEVTRLLGGEGIWLAELSPIERTLEEAFLELVGEPPANDGSS